MSDMLVLIPTRSRPNNAVELQNILSATSDVDAIFIVDNNDPLLDRYREVIADPYGLMVVPKGVSGIVWPLNLAARHCVSVADYLYIGFMGDDHRPRTERWDRAIAFALEQLETGLAYGNDLFMGERLPTEVFMTSNVVRQLGYMAPPELHHLFVDNYWYDLGNGLDRITYLPEVLIEHLHPAAGKAEWDDTYENANKPNVNRDAKAYSKFLADGKLARDVKKLRELL